MGRAGTMEKHYPAAINWIDMAPWLTPWGGGVIKHQKLGSSLGDLTCLHNTLLLVRGTLLSVTGYNNSAILKRSDQNLAY